jgi:hypothetical protein
MGWSRLAVGQQLFPIPPVATVSPASVTWYEPELDSSHSEFFYLAPANRLGASGISGANLGIAKRLVESLDSLISVDLAPLRMPLSGVGGSVGGWGSHGFGLFVGWLCDGLMAHVRVVWRSRR